MRGLRAARSAPASTPRRARAGALAPRAREDLVGHQHRHVAAQPVALAADRRSASPRPRRAASGENALSWTTSGHGGKYGSRPRATIAAGRAQERLRVAREVLVACRCTKHSGARRQPRVVGRDVVGDVVEDQPEPARGERGARRGQRRRGRRSARRRRSRARSTASRSRPRRAGRAARRGCPASRPGSARAIAQARRAALPDAHQPDGVDRQRGERVPRRGRHLGERERAPASRPRRSQPDRGVDLVDRRPGRQAHRPLRGRAAAPRRPARGTPRSSGTAARPSRSSRSGGWRRSRRRCRRGSTRGTGSGRASAGRSGSVSMPP